MPIPRHSRVTAVIMAGGRGERLWPRSRAALPKQFTQLRVADTQGDRTLIQSTVDRIRPLIPAENIFVVTGSEWAGLAREQLPEIPGENIIIEPAARNTAPCIALATSIIRRRYRGEDPVMAVLPADHVIRDDQAFRTALQAAIDVCRWPFIADASAGALPAARVHETGTVKHRPLAEGWADVAAAVGESSGDGAVADGDARAGAGTCCGIRLLPSASGQPGRRRDTGISGSGDSSALLTGSLPMKLPGSPRSPTR